MKPLENLPEIAARQLGGLEATPTLLAKIKINGVERKTRKPFAVRWEPVAAVCMALVLLVGGGLWMLGDESPSGGAAHEPNVIDSHSAGTESKATEAPTVLADVPMGSLSMGGKAKSGSSTLFAEAQGGSSFPLITAGGATYRMLSSPNAISSGMLGASLGAVSEYNIEPALGSGDVVSNIAAQGAEVYSVAGMEGAMVAANVNGSLRVFQRVSYAGTATIGNESLEDTLCSASDVKWMDLSGVGYAQGQDAQLLMEKLLGGADYQSTGMSGKGSLQIGLQNGLTLQLLVGEDTVSACGTWSCPDFFEAFHEAMGK